MDRRNGDEGNEGVYEGLGKFGVEDAARDRNLKETRRTGATRAREHTSRNTPDV